MPLEPCPTCHRHRRVDDAACPFCRSTSPLRATLLAAALGLTGCPPKPVAPVYGGPPDVGPVQSAPPAPAPEPATPEPAEPRTPPAPVYGGPPPESLPPAYGAPPPR